MMNGAPIIAYHSIDDSGSFISIAPSQFRDQMHFLWKKGYKTISLNEYINIIMMNKAAPPKSFILAFDDGYKNNYDVAFPILRDFEFTATIFVVTGFIGKMNLWQKDKEIPTLPLLSWAELSEMNEYGIEIQAHSHSHPVLPTLTMDEIRAEILKNKEELEPKLDSKVELFCYPYGKFDDRVIEILKDFGFKAAVTSRFGWNHGLIDSFRIERIVSRWFRKRPWAFRIFINTPSSPFISRAARWYAKMKNWRK